MVSGSGSILQSHNLALSLLRRVECERAREQEREREAREIERGERETTGYDPFDHGGSPPSPPTSAVSVLVYAHVWAHHFGVPGRCGAEKLTNLYRVPGKT